jgi:hypothetical protein
MAPNTTLERLNGAATGECVMESYRRALALADAVMLDADALYPYEPGLKSGSRWTFGTLAPAAWTWRGGSEPSWLEAQVLVENTPQTRLWGKVRFLQLRERRVEALTHFGPGGGFRSVSSLGVGGRQLVPWQDGDLREIDLTELEQPQRVVPLACEAACVAETVGDGQSRLVHERWAIQGLVRTSFAPVRAERMAARLTVRVENLTPCEASAEAREHALRTALLSTHLILGVEEGAFVSRANPPEWAREVTAACRNTGCHPTLTGEPGGHSLVLFSPFVLADHPHLAPEPATSPDAGEIEDLLGLR